MASKIPRHSEFVFSQIRQCIADNRRFADFISEFRRLPEEEQLETLMNASGLNQQLVSSLAAEIQTQMWLMEFLQSPPVAEIIKQAEKAISELRAEEPSISPNLPPLDRRQCLMCVRILREMLYNSDGLCHPTLRKDELALRLRCRDIDKLQTAVTRSMTLLRRYWSVSEKDASSEAKELIDFIKKLKSDYKAYRYNVFESMIIGNTPEMVDIRPESL